MKERLFAGCLAVVLSCLNTAFAESGMLGFWAFKDGAAGETVDLFCNSAGTGTYGGRACANAVIKPVYTNDAPGTAIYSDSTGKVKLCSYPQSLAFNYPAGATSAAGGGYAIIDQLAADLSKKSAYTIEYFIKFDETFDYWQHRDWSFYSKTSLWVGNGTTGYKVITPSGHYDNGHAQGVGLQAFTRESGFATAIGSKNNGMDYSDGKWHHIAVVYGDGMIALYADKEKVGSFAMENTDGTDLADTDFVLGTGRTGKRTTEPFHGQISCLRVSDGALTADEFLVAVQDTDITGMDVLGFWDFSDGVAGQEIGTITNRIDAEKFPGLARATTKVVPTYSDETPGLYVFADGMRTNLVATSPKSAYFGQGTYGNGGKIMLDALATSLMQLDGYTIEFFFRMDVPSLNNWRTLVSWKHGDHYSVKANLTCNTAEFNACTMEVLSDESGSIKAAGASGWMGKNLGTSWHHYAAVYTRADNKLTCYLDDQQTSVSVTNHPTIALYPLVLGNSAFTAKEPQEVFGGYISSVRVTARALAVDEFMVAANMLVPPPTVFALNFEEGTAGVALPLNGRTGDATSSYPDGILTYIGYNLHDECKPQYATSSKGGRAVLWNGEAVWTNNLCLRFPAAANLPTDAPNRFYYGAQLYLPAQKSTRYNPRSWTMEGFVQLEQMGLTLSSVKKGLIFGKAGNTVPSSSSPVWYPRYAWLLSYLENGKLKLEWTERPTPGFTDYGSSTGEYYKAVETDQPCLTDLKWHHVALSYDADARTFKLYFDGKLVLTQPLIGSSETQDTVSLFDGPYPYYFCRFPTTGGFEGCMDEIRFSSRALEPEEFEAFPRFGGLLLLK